MANDLKYSKKHNKKKTTATKKTTTKPKTTVAKKTTMKQKTTATKKTTTKPKTTVAKKTTTKPKTTVAKKTITKPKTTVVKKTTPTKKPTTSKSKQTQPLAKTSSKVVKPTKKSNAVKKKTVKKKKNENLRIKKDEELTTLEVLEAGVDGKEIIENEKHGKVFYLVFALIFYTGAFFYINNIVYDNGDLLQSAIFAFAAVFVVFVLLLFNVHMMFINFFLLPFKRLFKQSKHELKKEIIFSVGRNKVQTAINKYRSIFTLILYGLISIVLMYSVISGGIVRGNKILSIVTQSAMTELIFLIIVCSWQYLFNIIPSVLDKSLDAKNGFILTLSAAVMIIYVVFGIFDIVYLSEIMIFVLIIGFVALLGVNLNMIVGEINIFQNLRNRKNKAITRIVFLIFFGFHIYVIVYASVVAYSIYTWEPNSYNFAYPEMENVIDDNLFYSDGEPIDEVYTQMGVEIDVVYDNQGTEIIDFIDDDGYAINDVYDASNFWIESFYQDDTSLIEFVFNEDGEQQTNYFYYEGTLASQNQELIPANYGDFLYYTIVTVSTLGYGDITPSQNFNIAQAWGGFLSMYGLTFFALSIGFVSNIAMEGVSARREESNND